MVLFQIMPLNKLETTKNAIQKLKEKFYKSAPEMVNSFVEFENSCIEYWNIIQCILNTITTNIYLGLFVPREVK